jgi:acyl-CoA thioesterase FadM
LFPWLRLLRILLTLIGKPRVDLLSATRVRLRVWPHDLDFNLHVNNGRYLALADIGRIHWFARSGTLVVGRRQKAMPVIGDVIAKFRHELRVFQVFEIETRLLGWDEKWGFLEHRFIRNRRVLGVVAIRGVFRGPHGPIDPRIFLKELSLDAPSPVLPDWARDFTNASEAMSVALREEEAARAAEK